MSKPPLVVDLWIWSLDVELERQQRLSAYLSSQERARAGAFATERLRGRWIVARAGMRDVLARAQGVSPEALSFSYGAHGKPALRTPSRDVWFNLSHSEDVAVLALCAAPVGVDVERIADAHEDVAGAYFSAEEARALSALPVAQRARAFYRTWTAKEAFLKALGTGFSRASNSFTVAHAPDASVRLVEASWLEGSIKDWRFQHFEPMLGFMGTVAALSGESEFSISQHAWCG